MTYPSGLYAQEQAERAFFGIFRASLACRKAISTALYCECLCWAMSAESDPVVDLISRLVPAILRALYALEFAGRHLAPQTLHQLSDAVRDRQRDLDAALAESRG